jgi:hypothetical protein
MIRFTECGEASMRCGDVRILVCVGSISIRWHLDECAAFDRKQGVIGGKSPERSVGCKFAHDDGNSRCACAPAGAQIVRTLADEVDGVVHRYLRTVTQAHLAGKSN